MKATLNRGGTLERIVDVDDIQIPDLWHLAMALPNPDQSKILETWHIAHDLRKELSLSTLEAERDQLKADNARLREALEEIGDGCDPLNVEPMSRKRILEYAAKALKGQ